MAFAGNFLRVSRVRKEIWRDFRKAGLKSNAAWRQKTGSSPFCSGTWLAFFALKDLTLGERDLEFTRRKAQAWGKLNVIQVQTIVCTTGFRTVR